MLENIFRMYEKLKAQSRNIDSSYYTASIKSPVLCTDNVPPPSPRSGLERKT